MTVKGQAIYHWYTDPSTSLDSFQRLDADASLSVELGAVIRRYVVSTEKKGVFRTAFYRTVSHFCGVPPARPRSYRSDEPDRKKAKKEDEEALKKLGIKYEIKVTDQCDFGNFTVRSHLATTNTSGQSIVPFYLQPTIGGQDINFVTSLRGFSSYRFRGTDATFIQAEYGIPIFDPLEAMVFYDAGNAGDSLSALSFAHLRQDAGVGLTVRIQRMPVLQIYMAEGAGHGIHVGYNLVKQF